MPKKPLVSLVAGVAFSGAAALAAAQSTDALVDKYQSLAGSKDNARTLVDGLRNSDDFKLGNTTFETPTGKLGNGEVNIALSLAEAKLAEQKIASATPEQLKAALEPILQQRADGKGWGEIANAMGIRLGEVMRSDKARGQDRVARGERAERFSRPEKPERPEKPDRPEKPERGR